ncbi:MAG: DUF2334 domain-containing protein [Nanoarchaeota archaeon]
MKHLLISIHDVTPAYADDIQVILEGLASIDVTRYSLLVTPNFKGTWPLRDHVGFCQKMSALARAGNEIIVHGNTHRGGRLGINERLDLTNIMRSKDAVEHAIGVPTRGYVPPAWILPRKLRPSICLSGFIYYETLTKINFIGKGVYYNLPIGMGGIRSKTISHRITRVFSQVYSAVAIDFHHVQRYSFHPDEARNGNLPASLRLVRRYLDEGWTPSTYLDVYDELCARQTASAASPL